MNIPNPENTPEKTNDKEASPSTGTNKGGPSFWKRYTSGKSWEKSEWLTGALILVFLIVLLLVVSRRSIRFDLTTANLNTLSSVSQTLVKDLRDPMRIKVFISQNLPPPFNTLEQSLRDILTEYRSSAKGNFYYTFYVLNEKEADVSPTMKEYLDLAKDYGLAPQSIQTIDKDEVKLVSVYSGMIIEYGNIIERIDFIADNDALEYRLSSLLRKVTDKVNTLLALEDNIRISLYLPEQFVKLSPFFGVNGLEGLADDLKANIEELSLENYSKLDFIYESAPLGPEMEAQLKSIGAQVYPWTPFNARGTSYEGGIGVAAISVEYQDKIEIIELLNREEVIQITGQGLQNVVRYQVIPAANATERVEGSINSLLEITPPFAYLTDKGALDFAQGEFETSRQNAQSIAEGSNFGTVLKSRYQLAGISLEELTPQLYPVFMIGGVSEAFSEYELFLIDQYVMKGGSLVILTDSFVEEQQPGGGFGNTIPTWRQNVTGLEKLVEHYGLRIDPSIVMDKASFVSRNQNQRGGANEQQVYYVPIIENQKINSDLPYLRNVKGLFFIAGSPLFPVDDVLSQYDIAATRLFSSSDQSWNVSEDVSLVPYLIQPPVGEDEYTSFDLAYILEGAFPSYFAGKEIPKRETSEAEGEESAGPLSGNNLNKGNKVVQQLAGETAGGSSALVERASKEAKIFVMGTSEVVKNNVVDVAGKFPNAIFLLNVIDTLSGSVDWAVMRSKGQRVNPLDISTRQAGELIVWWKRPAFIKTVNMVGWPFLIILIGLWVYFYKLRVRRRVEEYFMKTSASSGASNS